MPAPDERLLAFAAIRDEGPFLVEWVTWMRMLGFQVLIAHNDCTDRSPALLAALAAAGWCEVVGHRPRPRQPPKASAYAAIRAHPALRAADWMLVCDVDEFPVLHRGRTAAGFLDATGRDAGGYALHWRSFGNGGHRLWSDGLVHRRFTGSGPHRRSPDVFVKTLLRAPRLWARLDDHAPAGWQGPGEAPILDAERRPLAAPEGRPLRFTGLEGITHRHAQLNHYVLRADESWALKRGTPSASGFRDRYTDHFHRMRNDNSVEDRSALGYADLFDPLWEEAMALPGVRRLHHLCCQDYVARLCAHQGRDPAADPRWRHHRAEAGRAPA